MNLQELFRPEDVLVGFRAIDKWDAIDRILDHLVQSGSVQAEARAELGEAVLNRERSMSTGMEHGLAIPHAAVDSLKEVRACLAVVGEAGLHFDSIDGGRTRLVVLLLIPRAKKLLHIRTLADVARVLGREDVREALFSATSSEEAWHALGETA